MESVTKISYLDVYTAEFPENEGERLVVELPNGVDVGVSRAHGVGNMLWRVDFTFSDGSSERLYFDDRTDIEDIIIMAGFVARIVGDEVRRTIQQGG